MNTQTLTDLNKSAQTGVFDDKTSGDLFCIVSVSDESEIKPYEVFQDIKTTINSRAPGESELKVIKRAFLSVREDTLQILIAKFIEKNLYLLCSNGAGAFVLREGKLVPLLKTSNSDYLTISGRARDKDTYLFATHEVIALLPLDVLENLLKDKEISGVEPLLSTLEEHKALIVTEFESTDAEFALKRAVPSEVATNIQNEFSPAKKSAIGLIDKTLEMLPKRNIRVEENEYAFKDKKKNRSASLAGVVLLFILGVSIFFGLRADKTKKAKEEYAPQVAEARHNLEEARELFELSPPRAQELILSAQQTANSLKDQGVTDPELDVLLQDIRDSLGPIAGIYESSASLYLDLSLISSGFSGDDLALSGGIIRVLDQNEKKLSGVELENKRTSIISGPDYLPDAIDVFAYENRSYVLSSDGIREVTDEVSLAIKQEWDSQRIKAKMFASNVYVLDPGQNQIWRYSGVRDGFLEKAAWLGEGIAPDFSDAVAISIDGDIWVLTSDGDIDRFSASVPINFFVENLKGDISGATDLFTFDESEYLYVLDTKNKRVVFINKNGQYEGEYSAEQLVNAKEIVVSEETKQLVFLVESKLFVIELRHL